MFDYVSQNYGFVSITNLTQAANALAAANQLDLVPQAKAPTKEELAKREQARQHRDWLDSLKPAQTLEVHALNAKNARIAKKEGLAKELTSINSQIEREISSHVRGHSSGRPNYSATESDQQMLRTVRDQYIRRTVAIDAAKSALAAVRAAKARM